MTQKQHFNDLLVRVNDKDGTKRDKGLEAVAQSFVHVMYAIEQQDFGVAKSYARVGLELLEKIRSSDKIRVNTKCSDTLIGDGRYYTNHLSVKLEIEEVAENTTQSEKDTVVSDEKEV